MAEVAGQLSPRWGLGSKKAVSKTRNIETPKLLVEDLKWETKEDAQRSISALYQYAEETAQGSIHWYDWNKNNQAWWSKLLRFLIIGFTAIGGLLPLLNTWRLGSEQLQFIKVDLGQVGYVFLSIAGVCIAFDKYFGFSSAWMRYMTTKMALEKSLAEFRIDWAMMALRRGDTESTPEQAQAMLQRLSKFITNVNGLVEKETQTWILEFKSSIAEIEKTAQSQAEALRPGGIDVTVANGADFKRGFTVSMDGAEIKKMRGTKYQIGYVSPGPHRITAAARVKNEIVDASQIVEVEPGETASVTLTLPAQT